MSPNASHRVRPGLSSAASLITTLLISFDQEGLNQHLNLVTPEYPFFESPWRDPYPPWQYPFMIAFTGVRGVVSLAAALSIPFAIGAGQPFPDRNLVLFLTFSVILVTLVGQGLTLPALVRALGLVERGRAEERELKRREARTRVEAARAALARL